MVWALCWKSARGNKSRCNDLLQEVSITLWIHFDELRSDAVPQEEKAWVRWWTRSVLDLQRRKERPSLLPLTAMVADTVAADDLLVQKEEMEHLMAALSPAEQELVRLHIEGYRPKEIASIMGLSREVVYQRLHRALGKARKALLVLFLLLVASTVAVAVVPSWRRWVFGRGEPAAADTVSVNIPAASSLALPSVADSASEEKQDPEVVVNWEYVGVGMEGWSVTWCRNDSSITYTRTSSNYAVTATGNFPQAFVENDTLKIDSMNISLKRTATTAALLALVTATQAQVAYDFQAVTPQGDTLLCTIVDSAQHHVSVRGDEWSYNTHYIHYSADLVLPDSVEHEGVRYAVTEVAEEAFQSHLEIETITVPDGVTVIGNKAFSLVPNVIYHGTAMGSPWGANTVNGYEEDSLFYSDNSKTRLTASRHITSVVVPATVRVIGTRAFYYISSLTSVTLPEGLDTIGNQAFGVCEGLEGITIPSTVKHIGKSAFYSAFLPSATVTIDDAELSIGNGAFAYSNMKNIELGNRVTFIDNGAFNSCTHLDSIIVPNSVQYIGRMAFCYNYSGSIKKIRLPEGIDTIRFQTFFGCTGLEEVNIPSTVVYIDSAAFHECWELTTLTLPAGLTHIGEAAFFQCRNIDTLISLAPVPPVAFANTFKQMNRNLVLIVPCGSVAAYRNAPYWNYFVNIQDDCEAVPEVELPEVSIFSAAYQNIVVEGAEGEVVVVYDMEGRQVADGIARGRCSLRVPAPGVYLVKIGTRPLQKVVVIR